MLFVALVIGTMAGLLWPYRAEVGWVMEQIGGVAMNGLVGAMAAMLVLLVLWVVPTTIASVIVWILDRRVDNGPEGK